MNEKDLAVLTQRFNDHEASCNARMLEVRNTFTEVKVFAEKTHNLIIAILLAFAGTSLMLLVAIVLKALKLA